MAIVSPVQAAVVRLTYRGVEYSANVLIHLRLQEEQDYRINETGICSGYL